MTSGSSTLQRITRCALSFTVVLAAVLLLLWIVLSGLVAVARNPYLVVPFWFLGMAGLFSCVGALLEASRGEEGQGPRPLRSLACLGAAAMVALTIWSQGRPVLDDPGAELAILGVVLAMAIVLGIGGLLLLSISLVSRGVGESGAPLLDLDSRRQSRGGGTAEGLVA